MFKKIRSMKNKTISTADGEKKYYGTEIEEKEGKWNQNYSISDGYWVIHKGKKHHIYR